MILYTTITDNKDILKDQIGEEQVIAFADTDINSSRWEIRRIESSESSPVRRAKIYKICPHLFFKGDSIFIDGNITLRKTATDIFNMAFDGNNADIAIFRHPERTNLYDEADVCIGGKLDKEGIIETQVKRYKQENVEIEGLYWGGFLIRRDTEKCRMFNNYWWSEICLGSKRDQISLPYVIYKSGINVRYLDCPSNFNDNEFYHRGNHNW